MATAAAVGVVVIVGRQGEVVIVRPPPHAEPLVEVVKREEGETAKTGDNDGNLMEYDC